MLSEVKASQADRQTDVTEDITTPHYRLWNNTTQNYSGPRSRRYDIHGGVVVLR